jgi:CHAD domain-containing protein
MTDSTGTSAPSSAPQSLPDLVGRYLAEQCTVILDADQGLRDGDNVVHTTRVAVRRLRSTLRTFADLFDIPPAAHLEDELIWWAGRLGEVRDIDILGVRLDNAVAQLPPDLVLGPVQSHLQTEIATRRKVAFEQLIASMDTERYRALRDTLSSWRSEPPFSTSAAGEAAKVGPYVKRAGKKTKKRLAEAIAAEVAGRPEAGELLHRARKAGKRHRYAAELAQPLWGAKADKIIDERKALQDLLGDHNDSLVTANFLRDVGARYGVRSGHNGFTYGLLYAREIESRKALAKRLKPYA